jgi:hypothetical protein
VGGNPDDTAVLGIAIQSGGSSSADPDGPIDSGDPVDPDPDPGPEVPEDVTTTEDSPVEDAAEAAPPEDSATAAEKNVSGDGPASARSTLGAKAGRPFKPFRMAAVNFEELAAQRYEYGPTPLPAEADPGPQRAEQQVRVANRSTARAYLNLLNSLNQVREEVVGEIAFNQTMLGSAIVMSTGLSVGYVIWLVRGGMLLSSLLSSLPAWQLLDPLPILSRRKDDDGTEDEESLESILKRKPEPPAPKTRAEDETGDNRQQSDRP